MSAFEVRLTEPMLKVLRVFVNEPRNEYSGAYLTLTAKVGAGTLYPMLARLEKAGWLTSEWEQADPATIGRPRKRYYRVTDLGQRKAFDALKALQLVQAVDFAWNA